MGKTNLLCRDLVRCASQLFLPCSDIKLYRVQLGPVICPAPPILGNRPAKHSSWNTHVKSKKPGPLS